MKNNRNQAWSRGLLFCALFAGGVAIAATESATQQTAQAEKLLIEALKNIQSMQLTEAVDVANRLSQEYPDYHLAQLLSADLLAMQAGNFDLIDRVHKAYPRSVSRLKSEAEVRWRHAHSDENQADNVLSSAVLKVGVQPHLVIVNLAKSRLYLYENHAGDLKLLANYYISMGTGGAGKQREGDRKTPIGVYHIVDWVPGERLADMYGTGALPLNYPNIWDQALGRTGHGIWLHGTPSNTFSRPPQSSQGCVVLNNQEMESLVSQFKIAMATPVIIVDKNFDASYFEAEKLAVLTEINAWLVEQGQQFDWSKVSVYRYPSEDGLYYATFPDTADNEHLVHQYWRRDHDGGWQLVLQTRDPIVIKTRLS